MIATVYAVNTLQERGTFRQVEETPDWGGAGKGNRENYKIIQEQPGQAFPRRSSSRAAGGSLSDAAP